MRPERTFGVEHGHAGPAVVLAAVTAGSTAFAQQNPPQSRWSGHPADPHRQALRLGKELNLSPDQTARLEPIFAERDQKVQALRSDTTLTRETMRQQMQAIQQNTRQELSGVLTPEQLSQLESMRGKFRRGPRQQGQPAQQSAPATSSTP